MKKGQLLIAFCMFVGITKFFGQGLCDTAYWNHTYLNNRLAIYDSCVTIAATIELLDPPLLTGDADYHIYTLPDPLWAWMVSYRTPAYQAMCLGSDSLLQFPGCLNVEEICKGIIVDGGTDGALIHAACDNWSDTTYLPNVGEHVLITGPFIYDTVHCWNEIHPVSNCSVIVPPSCIHEIDGNSLIDGLKIFPQPANSNIKFQFKQAPCSLTLIKLYNIKGQLLFVYGLSETNTLSLDVSSWASGDYLYSILSKENSRILKSGKFTISH